MWFCSKKEKTKSCDPSAVWLENRSVTLARGVSSLLAQEESDVKHKSDAAFPPEKDALGRATVKNHDLTICFLAGIVPQT